MSKLAGGPLEETLAAIARNLMAVLNARRGYSAGTHVFGLGDHNVYEEAKPHLDALVADMTDQVRRHEPRLIRPAVRYLGREGSLWARFEISGTVLGEPQRFKVLFHVILRDAEVVLLPQGSP
ncbi:MAG: GPW/gp25 family protein [Byssovorax sp.]